GPGSTRPSRRGPPGARECILARLPARDHKPIHATGSPHM
ncbi:MAG: hypothetical protein AVDCRST_MAG67-4034, partial [uncultured Solirubrobacteraceae bacterium]